MDREESLKKEKRMDKLALFLREERAHQEHEDSELDWFKKTLHIRNYREIKKKKEKTT